MTRALVTALGALALVVGSGAALAAPKKPAPKKDPPKPVEPPPAPEPPPEPPKPAEPPPLPGDPRRIIAIVEVHVGDGVPHEVGQLFQKDLDAQIDPKHFWIAPRQRVHDMMANSTKWTEGCIVGKCLRELKGQTGAEVALVASLTGSGTSFGSVVTLVRTDTGTVIKQDSVRCDVCTLNEAQKAAIEMAVKLVTSLPDKLPAPDAEEQAALTAAVTPLKARILELEGRPMHHYGVATVVTVTGLVAAAIGAVLYAKNSQNYALATAAAGGGLAVGGVVLFTF